MLEFGLICARAAQYLSAVILFGTSLFILSCLRRRGGETALVLPWLRPLLMIASAVLLVSAIAGLGAQTATMTGVAADAFRPGAWLDVATGASFGPAMAARIGLGLFGLLVSGFGRRSRSAPLAAIVIGGAALASFAWTGHGASDDGVRGAIHIGADIVHLLAAGSWLGALSALSVMMLSAARRPEPAVVSALHRGLEGFFAFGIASVTALLVTGFMNGWFLIGPAGVSKMLASAYGSLLCLKLLVFLAMLGLAALNRFKLAPALARALPEPPDRILRALRLSIAVETAGGGAILALVAALGVLPPPSAMG
jgi:putative copper resistance protein D